MTSRLTVTVVAVLFAALGTIVVSGQSGKYTAPRTPWGDPDLQGMWSYNDDVNTPFERPSELGGKVDRKSVV